jgi:hypothetical protein
VKMTNIRACAAAASLTLGACGFTFLPTNAAHASTQSDPQLDEPEHAARPEYLRPHDARLFHR